MLAIKYAKECKMYFNEHALEMSIMELFQDEGYQYVGGELIHRNGRGVACR